MTDSWIRSCSQSALNIWSEGGQTRRVTSFCFDFPRTIFKSLNIRSDIFFVLMCFWIKFFQCFKLFILAPHDLVSAGETRLFVCGTDTSAAEHFYFTQYYLFNIFQRSGRQTDRQKLKITQNRPRFFESSRTLSFVS